MLFQGLAELPDITSAIIVVKQNMSKEDLESIVLERLYSCQAGKMGSISPEFRRWLYSEHEADS
jgi:hypothetical protein